MTLLPELRGCTLASFLCRNTLPLQHQPLLSNVLRGNPGLDESLSQGRLLDTTNGVVLDAAHRVEGNLIR